jgi:hypothetical protein
MALITLDQAEALFNDAAFIRRVTLLGIRVALKVCDEPLDAVHPNVTAKRSNLALSWVSDRSSAFVGCLVRNVALDFSDVNMAAVADDAVVTSKIKGVFNAMAGVTPGDLA